MKKLVLSVAAAILASAVISAQTIAVLGFDSDSICLESRTGTMSDLLTDELVSIGDIAVLERKQVSKILEEMNFQASGYTDETTAKTIGKMLNADCIITGSTSMLGEKLVVTARTIDVETAKILCSAKMSVSSWNEFSRRLPEFAKGCVKNLPAKNWFAGTWEGGYEADGGDDFFTIVFSEKNKCTVSLATTNAFGDSEELSGSGSYSYDKNILRIDARLSTDLGVARKISWRSVYSFGEGNDSFSILVKPEGGKQVRATFARTD